MSWQIALIALFGVLVTFSACYLLAHEILERRRDRRTYRINPMYRVGGDCKERS